MIGMKTSRLTFLLLYISGTCIGQDCKGLFALCNDDCECCGHPDDKSVRCEKRNSIGEKRCYIGRSVGRPCANHSECLSQNCLNGKCVHNNRDRVAVPECSLGGFDSIATALSGATPLCSCPQNPTDTVELAIDGNLSTDYTNYQSQDYSGLVVEPTFNAPLKRMEICSSNQDESNDPLCYKLAGWCADDDTYSDIQSGVIPFTSTRQECVDIKITGRQHYSAYKIELGCRRGGYLDVCPDPGSPCDPSKANCAEVTPLGVVPTSNVRFLSVKSNTESSTCTPNFENYEYDNDAFEDFDLQSVAYDTVNDETKYTYTFVNKKDSGHDYPDLSHAVLQYVGGCCVERVKIYTIVNGAENTIATLTAPEGLGHLQSPKPTVCMSGIDLDVSLSSAIKVKYYYEIIIAGNFPTTTTVDYAIKGGQKIKYGKVAGPDCRCLEPRALSNKRLFRGLPVDIDSSKRRALACVDQPNTKILAPTLDLNSLVPNLIFNQKFKFMSMVQSMFEEPKDLNYNNNCVH